MTSLWDRYRQVADAAPGRLAVVDQAGSILTHGELSERAERVAAGLRSLGLDRGDHLGVFLPNRVTWPVVALAAARAGVGLLGLNTRFREAELDHLLGVAGVGVVLAIDRFLGIDGPALLAGLERPPRLIVDDSGSAGTVSTGEVVSLADLAAGAGTIDDQSADGDPLIGFTTSGTTGFPKVAMHTAGQTLRHLDAAVATFGLDQGTVTLVPLPFCGAFGYSLALSTLLAGGTVVAHETWDPDAAAQAIAEHGVTWFSASDDMLLSLLASPDFRPDTTWTTGGFADFTNAGAQAVEEVDRRTGGRTRLAGLYGSSEGFALMATWSPYAPIEDRCRNGGHLIAADREVRVCDPDSGRILGHREPGELQFRGPNLITGYLNNPGATAEAFTDDGWYRAGDLGYTVRPDDRGRQGFVFLARLGDSLRLRGFLCDPAEIEKHLECHPSVDLAQVVGVNQPGTGDVAVAFVRPPAGIEADEATLAAHCRDGLANYKRPERIVVVDEFPVTDGPNGVKIRKVELRDRAAGLIGPA